MSTPAIDYDALAKQAGAVSSTPAPGQVDYEALAKQAGAVSSTAPSGTDASKKEEPGYWEGLKAGAEGLVNTVLHPIDSITSMGKQVMAGGTTPYGTPIMAPTGNQQIDAANQQAQQGARDDLGQQGAFMAQHPAYTAGMMTPAAVLGAAGKAVPLLAPVGQAVRESALGDVDAAAMRGLHVSPQSPKAAPILSAVEGARPFLQGVQGLEDLQNRIPAAKAEIWKPYQDTLEKIGSKQVKGPDGDTTTVQALEDRRLELSAQLRTLRKGGPEAVALAQQKGLTQASLIKEESAVKFALDPQLRQAGIDPVAIRKAFGQVSAVGSKVAGKTTTGEASQPYGLSKLPDIDLAKPLSNISNITSAGRDVVAGRYFSANPTDLNIREAFRQGGPKPDFTVPVQAAPQPAGFLPATTGGPIELPYVPEMSGGERLAALMYLLRRKPQLALPAKASPLITPPPSY